MDNSVNAKTGENWKIVAVMVPLSIFVKELDAQLAALARTRLHDATGKSLTDAVAEHRNSR